MQMTLPARPVVLTALLAMPLLAFAAWPAAVQDVTTSPGQEREAVLAVVQAFFDTMASKDLPGAERVVMPEGRFYSVRQQDGRPVMRTFTNQQYLEDLPGRTQAVRERMWDPEVRHCGIDAFDLVKTDSGWKIAGGTYTVEGNCPPSPLGPLKQ